jgi:hypothetical protein
MQAPQQYFKCDAMPFNTWLTLIGAFARLYIAHAKTRFLCNGSAKNVSSSMCGGSNPPFIICWALALPFESPSEILVLMETPFSSLAVLLAFVQGQMLP